MQEKNSLITVDSILETLNREGYKLSKRTFQYYVQAGLLPKGMRKGAASGGVRFYYRPEVLGMVRLIFTLKARGFKLNEIKEQIMAANEPLDNFIGDAESSTSIKDEVVGSLAAKPTKNILPSDLSKGEDLYQKVMRLTPGGDALQQCLQCGTCGGSCPSANDMDYTPRKLLALLQGGYYTEVLTSNTAWFCISCYYCTIRCPQQIPITELLYTIKELAVKAGIVKITDAYDVSRIYINLLEKYGRSFDMGLAFRYHLASSPSSKSSWGSLTMKHQTQDKVVSGPSRIKNIKQLQNIISRAKEISRENS